MVSGGDVAELFQLSAGSRFVVYAADQDTDEQTELYSVPLAGGTPVKLNDAMPIHADVRLFFRISDDGNRVVYSADVDSDEHFELYYISILGGTPIKLNQPSPPAGSVFSVKFGLNDTYVVYMAQQNSLSRLELYSVKVK